MSPMTKGGVSPAAPTHMSARSMEDTVIIREESTEAITEPGCDDGGANNVQKRNSNAELCSGNEQEQRESSPG